jgi:hypothetical protein
MRSFRSIRVTLAACAVAVAGVGLSSCVAPAPPVKLAISPATIDFGSVKLFAKSAPHTVKVTNIGTAPVLMNGNGGNAAQFPKSQNCSGKVLAVGHSCDMTYTYVPVSTGPLTATATGTWKTQAFSIKLKGTGVALAGGQKFRISPTAFDFGSVPVGSPSPVQQLTITNISGAALVMSGAGGGAGQFGGSQDCQGRTIAAGASCHMFYQFTPPAVGAATGSTGGNWNGQTFSFAFKGIGSPRFRITPTAMDFGTVAVGTVSPQQLVTITNLGSVPVVMSGAGGGAGQFGGSQDCQGLTIAAGKSCHMYYQFSPSALGPVTGSTGGNWNGQTFAFAFKGIGG